MNMLAKTAIASSLSLVVVVGSLGCNGKTAQCNKLIEKVNASMTKMDESTKKLDGKDDAKDLVELGAALDTAKKEVEAVDVSDAKLKTLQGQFVKSIDTMAVSTKAMSAGIDKKDEGAVKTAMTKLEASGAENSKLTDEINKYCTGSP